MPHSDRLGRPSTTPGQVQRSFAKPCALQIQFGGGTVDFSQIVLAQLDLDAAQILDQRWSLVAPGIGTIHGSGIKCWIRSASDPQPTGSPCTFQAPNWRSPPFQPFKASTTARFVLSLG
jgi:hypothetical protein